MQRSHSGHDLLLSVFKLREQKTALFNIGDKRVHCSKEGSHCIYTRQRTLISDKLYSNGMEFSMTYFFDRCCSCMARAYLVQLLLHSYVIHAKNPLKIKSEAVCTSTSSTITEEKNVFLEHLEKVTFLFLLPRSSSSVKSIFHL